MAVYAKTKDELKKYIENKESEIIVEGKLAKQLKKCEVLKHATPANIAILTGSIAAVGATIAAIILSSGPTMGLSYILGTPAVVTEAALLGSTFSIGTAAAVTMLILGSSLGASILISLFKDYESEFEAGVDKGKAYFKFKRKKEK